MAKIYEIIKWKHQKQKEPVSISEYLKRAQERKRKQPPRARGKPAEVLTFEELRRLMGDVGPRRFLKDRGNNRRK